jgi:phosphate transport system permease protein
MTDARPLADSAVLARIARRRRGEAAFRMTSMAAVIAAVAMLCWLLLTLVGSGVTAFYQHMITLDVALDQSTLDPSGARDAADLQKASYRSILQAAMHERFPAATGRDEKRELFALISAAGATDILRRKVRENPALVGTRLKITAPVSDDVDQLLKGRIDRDVEEALRPVSDRQIAWIDALRASGEIRPRFNATFFTATDSRDPELAGIAGAVVGSAMALAVALMLAAPIGVAAALYLEEFAPKNRVTDIIEININNLAAVPSIVFGLLGLAVFLNFFGLPRSAPLVGGFVLALMTLPTIIIAARSALAAVPPSIAAAALSVGASPVQAVFHHKLPLAAPGILTGIIIGMARALGETAPLLMIGMVAFVTEVPASLTEPASALPVQIFLWSDSPERAWAERTSAAILVLLVALGFMNAAAIFLRQRLEKRW